GYCGGDLPLFSGGEKPLLEAAGRGELLSGRRPGRARGEGGPFKRSQLWRQDLSIGSDLSDSDTGADGPASARRKLPDEPLRRALLLQQESGYPLRRSL